MRGKNKRQCSRCLCFDEDTKNGLCLNPLKRLIGCGPLSVHLCWLCEYELEEQINFEEFSAKNIKRIKIDNAVDEAWEKNR